MDLDQTPEELQDTDGSRFLGNLSDTDVARMLSERERNLEGTPREADLPLGVERFRRRALDAARLRSAISDEAYDLIVGFETGGRSYYERSTKERPIWPGGESGVTIGFGYDLGYVGAEEFEANWRDVLSAAEIQRLKAVIGKKGQAAKRILARVLDTKVTWDMGETVFGRASLPKFIDITTNALDNTNLVHPHSLGALVSLVFNRGAGGFTSVKDRYREMRKIRELMTAKDFDAIPEQIRSMKRIWAGQGLDGLLKRRDEEADLFELGLDLQRIGRLQRDARFRRMRNLGDDRDSLYELPRQLIDELTYEPEDGSVQSDFKERRFGSRARAARFTTADVYWPNNDENSPDYRHLPRDLKGKPFTLTAEDLDDLIVLNSFEPNFGDGKLVIGLRGAQLVEGLEAINKDKIEMLDVRPDHHSFRCLIGIYDKKGGKISLFTASTVPNANAVVKGYNHYQIGTAKQGNILPTGCYHYCVGTHFGSVTVPRVFRLGLGAGVDDAGEATVMRSDTDVVYGTKDVWDQCVPKDNIHPAHGTSAFSSLGCLTVRGKFTSRGSTDQWKNLQQVAGISTGTADGKRFDLMLLTGLDFAAVSAMRGSDTQSLRCLRHGSKGERVAKLQETLGMGSPDGEFGPATKKRLGDRQKSELGWSTGLYSYDMDEYLGFGIWDDMVAGPRRTTVASRGVRRRGRR